jgi:hypothetical protein
MLFLLGAASTLLLAGVLTSHLREANAQVECCIPPLMPVFAVKWPKYSTVTVIIEGGQGEFTDSERQSIEAAFTNWNNSNSCATCTNVSFNGFQFGNDPGGGGGTYWVEYKDEEGNASTGMSSTSAGTSLRRAVRRGLPQYLPLYVRSTMEHESSRSRPRDSRGTDSSRSPSSTSRRTAATLTALLIDATQYSHPYVCGGTQTITASRSRASCTRCPSWG